jgi:DNA modification methylase
MVSVFREVWRVLRLDGTLWLNIGDSYAGARAGPQGETGQMHDRSVAAQRCRVRNNGSIPTGLKPKDLVGIPWRVAFALQSDGWWLRSDIIWAKPNPMPESVRDRPTKSHEYLFMLAKSPKYYFDQDAVREADSGVASGNGFVGRQGGARSTAVDGGDGNPARFEAGCGRNIRDVWTVATQPFHGAHFAVMPPKLVEPCIKAGCPEGGTVLDPFAGAGTVGLVADRLRRAFVGVELNPEFASMARYRIVDDCPLFAHHQ